MNLGAGPWPCSAVCVYNCPPPFAVICMRVDQGLAKRNRCKSSQTHLVRLDGAKELTVKCPSLVEHRNGVEMRQSVREMGGVGVV